MSDKDITEKFYELYNELYDINPELVSHVEHIKTVLDDKSYEGMERLRLIFYSIDLRAGIRTMEQTINSYYEYRTQNGLE